MMNQKDNWRMDLHLMPPFGWLNDPNGLCFYQGEYHVFFQYSPGQAEGGLKHWGHYKSKDLVTWEFTGIPVKAEEAYEKDGAYSGCAFVEDDVMHLFYTGNVKMEGDYDYVTAGRGANVIHAIYTSKGEVKDKKCILTNADYPKEYTCHVRDPKVWKENDTYYMVLGGRVGDEESNRDGNGEDRDQGKVLVYVSEDLEHWRFLQNIESAKRFGYMWECPDYFQVGEKKILSISPQGLESKERCFQNVYQSGFYELTGDIAGEYKLHSFEEWDYGFDFYAPQTFQDDKGRRIMIGWMGVPDIPYTNPTVARGWQHALTLPREIVVEDGIVKQRPVKELEFLRKHHQMVEDAVIAEGSAELCVSEIGAWCDIKIDGLRLEYQEESHTVKLWFADESGYGREERFCDVTSLTDFRIFVDASAVEVFMNGGAKVMTTRYYPIGNRHHISVNGEGQKSVLYTL